MSQYCAFKLVLDVQPEEGSSKYRVSIQYCDSSDGRGFWYSCGVWSGNNYNKLINNALAKPYYWIQRDRDRREERKKHVDNTHSRARDLLKTCRDGAAI